MIPSLWTVTILPTAQAQEVVASPSVQQQALTNDTLRAIFGMRLRTWPDGTLIRVFVLPDEYPLHISFCKETLNIFPHQLRSAWDRLVFSGTGQAPEQVSSEEEMRARIATTPGAIGYLPEIMIDDSVRVLQITP